MPSDVSDEALAAMCEDAADDILGELFAGQNHKSELVQMLVNLVTEARDLTAAACRHACHERALYLARSGNDDAAHGAAGCIADIASAFPGAAAAEGEARDG